MRTSVKWLWFTSEPKFLYSPSDGCWDMDQSGGLDGHATPNSSSRPVLKHLPLWWSWKLGNRTCLWSVAESTLTQILFLRLSCIGCGSVRRGQRGNPRPPFLSCNTVTSWVTRGVTQWQHHPRPRPPSSTHPRLSAGKGLARKETGNRQD